MALLWTHKGESHPLPTNTPCWNRSPQKISGYVTDISRGCFQTSYPTVNTFLHYWKNYEEDDNNEYQLLLRNVWPAKVHWVLFPAETIYLKLFIIPSLQHVTSTIDADEILLNETMHFIKVACRVRVAYLKE